MATWLERLYGSFLHILGHEVAHEVFPVLLPFADVVALVIQITSPPISRSSSLRRLSSQIPREAGTSAGAPGSQNMFCMSMTTRQSLPDLGFV